MPTDELGGVCYTEEMGEGVCFFVCLFLLFWSLFLRKGQMTRRSLVGFTEVVRGESREFVVSVGVFWLS